MSYYLEFGPQVKMKNPLNGQFNKGHATWNKGMTWDEMGISPRGIECNRRWIVSFRYGTFIKNIIRWQVLPR